MSKHEILNATWFTEIGRTRPIGIVIKIDEVTNECKAYIGTGNGHSAESDARSIISMGAKFPVELVQSIHESLTGGKP